MDASSPFLNKGNAPSIWSGWMVVVGVLVGVFIAASAFESVFFPKQTTEQLQMAAAQAAEWEKLPNQTPNGVVLDTKENFYIGANHKSLDFLKAADDAVALARSSGLRCDTISSLRPWLLESGYSLNCNKFRYEYNLRDNGRGWQVTIADEDKKKK